MKVKKMEIIGLYKIDNDFTLEFNSDINILTGRNGCGKTTILKLLWYCISGNIERAVKEISFNKVIIETDTYSMSISKSVIEKNEAVSITIMDEQGNPILDIINKFKNDEIEKLTDKANHLVIELLRTSIFFPTFRRIEGGFSMTENTASSSKEYYLNEESIISNSKRSKGGIQHALEEHAKTLSVRTHKFVTSISTMDIQKLVDSKYNEASLKVENLSKSLTKNIFSEIKKYKSIKKSDKKALEDAVITLDTINQDVTDFEKKRAVEFKSITVLSDIIVKIFSHKGIKLNSRITLGDINNSIRSDILSAGEKQMLSFLCYNALFHDCPFFIDEPELSLHVDWQRILLKEMTDQRTNNQFFIATHSPFIYTQYEDKEINIDENRGDNVK